VESRFGDTARAGRYPLELISGKNDDSMNSTFGHRDAVDRQTAILFIHPADAQSRGIREGMLVQASNERGECWFEARVSLDVPRGVVRVPSVRWNKRSLAGLGLNRLTSERLTDFGGGPTFYSCLVEVAAAGGKLPAAGV
jgi:anaerobic selenocysteine-containing dehydrogenase